MDATLQIIQNLVDEISEHTKQSCFSNSATIFDALLLLSQQKPEYSGFQFKGKGGFSLVLQAVNANSKKQVALKIREFDQSDKKGIELIQREQILLKMFTFCKYIVQVNQSFYLTRKKKNQDVEAYFVEEMELFDGNLAQYFLRFKKNSQSIDENTKILMVIQMLDAINTLHQRNIMHRDVKPQNFLVQDNDQTLPTLKLCDLSFSSPLSVSNSKSFLSAKGTAGYIAPEAADNQCRLQSDLFSLGIIILELDNTSSFDLSAVKQTELALLFQGFIFEKHTINKTSTLYKLACVFLKPEYQNRSTASQALFMLLKQAQNIKKLQLFSIVTLDQLSSESKFLPKYSEYQASIQLLESHKASDQKAEKEINLLIAMYKAYYNCSFSLKEEQIQSILKILLSSGEFQNCEYLGMGATGLVFAIYNIKHKRHTTLKLCLCQSEKGRAEKLAEAGLMRKCQMPNIIKFYGHQFLEDEQGNAFVIEEYERCSCTLSQFLKEQKQQKIVLSDKKKLSMAIQMMDSVNYLHEHSILHQDIKLDNFLVSSNNGEEITVKLSDFDQSAYLQDDWYTIEEKGEFSGHEILPPYNCLINSAKFGSPPYYAPERFLKPSQTTKATDCFSVGLCIAILDNYMTFTESFLCSYYELINKDSTLFPLILSLLEYSPLIRSSLESAISKIKGCVPQHSVPITIPLNNKVSPRYLRIDKILPEQFQIFLTQIARFTNLSSLNWNLWNAKINDDGAQSLSKVLKLLTNLSSLELNLRNNNLTPAGIESLSEALKTQTNLSSLNLNLRNNKLSAVGSEFLSKSIKSLTNLSSLNLNLRNTSLSPGGVEFLSEGLTNNTNLSKLNLNLGFNEIDPAGAGKLSNAVKTLCNLSNLNLNFGCNSISDEGVDALSKAITTLSNLQNINLNFKKINCRDAGAESLQKALMQHPYLSHLFLQLSMNNLSAAGAEFLSKIQLKMTYLSNLYLNLRCNKLLDAGADNISKLFPPLNNLSILHLNVGFNSLNADGSQSLSNALTRLINLSYLNLNLGINKLNDDGVQYVSNALKTLTNLQCLYLNLEENNLSDEGAEILFKNLTTLTNLSSLILNLRDNNLSEIKAEKLLKGFQELTNLKYLSFLN